MFCENCGKALNKEEKFCSNCGQKVENENHPQKNIIFHKILSNKSMLIMFLINYMLFVISTFDWSNFEFNMIFEVVAKCIIFFLFDVFHSVPIVLSILNVKKYKAGYVISCLVFSVILIMPMLVINLILAIENLGVFSSEIVSWIFIIQSLLLILTCLFKLIFKIKV